MTIKQSGGFEILKDCSRYAGEIAAVTRAAFARRYGSGEGEVALIAALRADSAVVVELAARDGGGTIGHVMFSRAEADPPLCRIAALAPVAVRIDRQRSGIGGTLIRAGLAACAKHGFESVIVLGDPAYYGRFGFRADLAKDLNCAYAGPDFQALEIRPGALTGVKTVSYARAFAQTVG